MTDDDLDRAVEALAPWHRHATGTDTDAARDAARAVLDAVAAHIARRERESIVAWLRSRADGYPEDIWGPVHNAQTVQQGVERGAAYMARHCSEVWADDIEAHADQEDDR